MHYFLLFALVITSSISIAMDYDFYSSSSLSATDSTPTIQSLDYTNPSDYPFMCDYGAYNSDNTYSAKSTTRKKATSPIIELSKATQNILPTDCIGLINQQLLEETNTHTWAARATLIKGKSIPIENNNRYSGELALHPSNHIVHVQHPCNDTTETQINYTNLHSTQEWNSFKITIAQGLQGVSINPTTPYQCAIQTLTQYRKTSNIYVVDLETEAILKTITLRNMYKYIYLSQGLLNPAIHNQDIFFTRKTYPARIYHYDMRSGTTSRIYSSNTKGIYALSQHNGQPYISRIRK